MSDEELKEAKEFWGEGYTEDEYEWLYGELEVWSDHHDYNDPVTLLDFKVLSMVELEHRKILDEYVNVGELTEMKRRMLDLVSKETSLRLQASSLRKVRMDREGR